ncbi:MAG TPA: cytochrome d ubiquinol oxidase subunit II [Candidatus Alistipes faecigallinarum]|uniref:cytochrome d ubiquinol oxidase subunit II n=1 Tax=uncultured Alistipes sp. TaxID=538949 RepID=UPI001F9044AF|nr:cytochrome d ubiquinol oxidase subunit II [uncultured Alistipes sp.]HIY47968.1 cytochrome d ubiquinol oxidase subunit II [Candidatus Alistipes faecigallinarum]
MDTLTLLQHYWWFLIALLGALLVFLLFVQGGQALLYRLGHTEEERNMIVNALGRKWELTFTTLVTFGGAFFASFPLFYSTSFGGAVYVWMAILLCFVVQAVAYEYRRKPSNVFGERTFDIFLMINGLLGPLLLGMAVGTLFTGAPFTVDRLNLANAGGDAVVISQWTTPWHGLDAVANPRNWALGLSVALLSMILACQFLAHDVDDETIRLHIRGCLRRLAGGFVTLFVIWLLCLLMADGWTEDPTTGVISAEPHKYLHNLLEMPVVAAMLFVGVIAVLASIGMGWVGKRRAIWFGGAGTVLTVLALLLLAGWNNTVYYPSTADMQASLTIRNSSSSLFTLKTMFWVSLFIPVVVAYIWYAWRALSRRPITREEIRDGGHQY